MEYYHVANSEYENGEEIENKFESNHYYNQNVNNELEWLEKEFEKYYSGNKISRKKAIYCWDCKYCAIRFKNRMKYRNNKKYNIYLVSICSDKYYAPMEITDFLSKKTKQFNNLENAIKEYWKCSPENEWHKKEILSEKNK
jgi:hypothetical protein